jgi:hypothetical protein
VAHTRVCLLSKECLALTVCVTVRLPMPLLGCLCHCLSLCHCLYLCLCHCLCLCLCHCLSLRHSLCLCHCLCLRHWVSGPPSVSLDTVYICVTGPLFASVSLGVCPCRALSPPLGVCLLANLALPCVPLSTGYCL